MYTIPLGVVATVGYQAVDLDGVERTGLDIDDFTVSLLTANTGSAEYEAATETVYVVNALVPSIGGPVASGFYEFRFTPEYAQRYLLTIAPNWTGASAGTVCFLLEVVEVGVEANAGYATPSQVKLILGEYGEDDISDDALILELIKQASVYIDDATGRTFVQASRTEYPKGGGRVLNLEHYPVGTITSVHVSTTAPRVYDSTTLLSASTDYFVSTDTGQIERAYGRWPEGINAIRVVHTSGSWAVPVRINRACYLLCAYWKRTQRGGSFESMTSPDGTASFGPSAAWFAEAREIIEQYRSPRVG